MRAIPVLLCLVLGLAACDVTEMTPAGGTAPGTGSLAARNATRSFAEVVNAVEPVAEAQCRQLAPKMNCDFRIVVDTRRGEDANAFQSVDASGRPVLTFTMALIASVDSPDELAFVMSHEAAHHILNHLDRQRRNAEAGAVVFAGLATMTGGTNADVVTARKLGAAVGARSYSKEFELEADELGAIMTYRAGYDSMAGAQFFTRIPDPGDRFLGTHPPNAERMARVRSVGVRMGFCRSIDGPVIIDCKKNG